MWNHIIMRVLMLGEVLAPHRRRKADCDTLWRCTGDGVSILVGELSWLLLMQVKHKIVRWTCRQGCGATLQEGNCCCC
jgi:hypothetical protein